MKKIKECLHLYLGCNVLVTDLDGNTFTDRLECCRNDKEGLKFGIYEFGDMSIEDFYEGNGSIKPFLRPFSDIKAPEVLELLKTVGNKKAISESDIENVRRFIAENGIEALDFEDVPIRNVFELNRFLLSKHFDLFGLINEGLAVDATKN